MIVLARSQRIRIVAVAGVIAISAMWRLAVRAAAVPSTLSQNQQTAAPAQAPDAGAGSPQTASPPATVPAARGVEIVVHGGYPELRVDGAPFFIHSAGFFYYRIPADLWEVSLERYRSLGINTIDIYIPWNWHEPQEGQFDFDGHTNPRRDLRRLLKLITGKNLKMIARPGPVISDEWRYGGYPKWLLEREDFRAAMPAEFRMNKLDLLEGRFPPLGELSARDAAAAAKDWLANPLFMDAARKWLAAVGSELEPYAPPAAEKAATARSSNFPLLFVQLDGDLGFGGAADAEKSLTRYLEALRDALEGYGLRAPVFVDAEDPAAAVGNSADSGAMGVMGHWFMHSGAVSETKMRDLTARDASTIEVLAEELKMEAKFPPALIEYQAGWHAPADDDRPEESAAENTLDSSRLFLAHGLHGISYFPLQDSVTPTGWSVPWANQNELWNAALDPNGHPRRLADAVARNGEVLLRWGPELAAAHERADFGMVWPIGAGARGAINEVEVRRAAGDIGKIERLTQLDHLSSELVDPERLPSEQLLRDPLIFLPVLAGDADGGGDSARAPMSEKSQQALVEYVRRGGTLFIFPKRPEGNIIAELWKDAPARGAQASEIVSADWRFGAGRVLESSKDFYSWIDLQKSFEENREPQASAWAMRVLREVVILAGVHPAVTIEGNPAEAAGLMLSELVSNEGTGLLGARTGGHGWLSAINLNGEDTANVTLSIRAPWASSIGESPERIEMDVSVPPREALLLPLGAPLCAEAREANCSDAVIDSGAELISAAREGKTLELVFYAAARSEIKLRLEQPPSHVEVEDSTPETKWMAERHELTLIISRGASPGFRRKVKVQLPYVPHVAEARREADRGRGWSELSVVNAVRMPLGPGAYLGSSPPLVVIDDPRNVRVTFEASNTDPDYRGDIDVNVTGAYKGTATLRIAGGQIAVDTEKIKPVGPKETDAPSAVADENGLLHGNIEAREGHERKRLPIFYVPLRAEGVTAYRYDLEGDGELEWVLEDAFARLIVSPASGGRALALVDKGTGFDLLSSVGGLRDELAAAATEGEAAASNRGNDELFSRTYEAKWIADGKNTALDLRYRAAEAPPNGAEIEKSVELEEDVLTVSYRVELSGAREGDANVGASARGAESKVFIASQSVPALDEPGRVTRFCWSSVAKQAAADVKKDSMPGAAKPPASAAPPAPAPQHGANPAEAAEHCEDFAPGGAAIDVPAAANRLEIRTPARPGLALNWDSGRLTIRPKRYSALVESRLADVEPGNEARETLHFRILAPD